MSIGGGDYMERLVWLLGSLAPAFPLEGDPSVRGKFSPETTVSKKQCKRKGGTSDRC